MSSVPEGTMVRQGEASTYPGVDAALNDTALYSVAPEDGCAFFAMEKSPCFN